MKKLLILALVLSIIGLQASAKKVTAIDIVVTSESDLTLKPDQADQTTSGNIKKGDVVLRMFPIVTDSATPITVADLKDQVATVWGVDTASVKIKEGGRELATTTKFDAAYSGKTPVNLTAAIAAPTASK